MQRFENNSGQMNRLYYVFLILFYPVINIYAQVENVSTDNQVYIYLDQMYTRGILKEYNNILLPLSKNMIQNDLKEIELYQKNLSAIELKLLKKYLVKFDVVDTSRYQSVSDFPKSLLTSIIIDRPKFFYNYRDSSVNFYLNPILNYTLLSDKKKSASLFEFGSKISGSVKNYFGFLYQVSNGIQTGDKSVAENDNRIKQSFTFNQTGIHYFDNTEGYAKFHYGILDLQAGRERILFGQGNIDKLILSDIPPLFDFIRFDLNYKSITYNFIHGWLVQPPYTIFNPGGNDSIMNKNSKYIASSRLGVNFDSNLNVGISQVIIYANRPVELAYLNPFLFFESAQRSMYGLDNSFLIIDSKYKIRKDLIAYFGLTIDDLDFNEYFKEGWNTLHNRTAWQFGLKMSDPLNIKNSSIEIEYLQLRPYIYSHDGIGESLVYSNNGYLLGPDLLPNSEKFSALFNLWITENIFTSILYSYSIHGDNITGLDGKLIKNVGGDPFVYSLGSDNNIQTAALLDGIKSYNSKLTISINYEAVYGVYFNGFVTLNSDRKENISDKNIVWGAAIKINFE
jgi:hypothetical protein